MTTSSTQIPRLGLQGYWDKFIGPDASMAENLVALVPAVLFIKLFASYLPVDGIQKRASQ